MYVIFDIKKNYIKSQNRKFLIFIQTFLQKKNTQITVQLNFNQNLTIQRTMIYRNLGNSGLKVSVISYGNMFNYREETRQDDKKIISKGFQNGINYFDTAQLYAEGQAQSQLGSILKELQVPRQNVVIGTKIWVSKNSDLNSCKVLNRKHIHEAIEKSLERLQIQYVDIVFAHAFDEKTPLQEICRSFNEIIEDGKALHWGTSNWDAQTVFEAFSICQKYRFQRPICAQNEYHMLKRQENEYQYQNLYKNYKYGMMAWSPLAGGFLTGKYFDGIDESRLTRLTDKYSTSKQQLMKLYYYPYKNEETKNKLKIIQDFARKELDCSLSQFALAWCIKYRFLSTAITGARNEQQLLSNLEAIKVMRKITRQIEDRIVQILKNQNKFNIDFNKQQEYARHCRPIAAYQEISQKVQDIIK